MLSREVQAENMAKRLIALADTEEGYMFQGKWWNTLPIIIVGKAYKPLVPYEAGSSSMLVGHYIENQGYDLYYYDEQTGDIPDEEIFAKGFNSQDI